MAQREKSSFHHERPPSPVPTCVSMKSDQSEDRFIDFKHDVTDGTRAQNEGSKPDAVNDQFTQEDLNHIFQVWI
ncbi:hypothetical protein AALO_G00305180 [Alosa alosa]|uniref:Uncharacterized protein n=1 Tax=Alosa alosa TaxID=278164 RepID=A0AAV6FG12_9TELE|nr:hypothetical protein AALO_G00305180 [Alosa alosa]